MEELQELSELDQEIGEALAEFEIKPSVPEAVRLADYFSRYASTISLLFEFEDLAYSVKSLAQILSQVTEENLAAGKGEKLAILINGFARDLENWRTTIFIDKSTRDIHYLDSSLFSSCLQIEAALFDTGADISDGDELELF